jgi:glycosyltransferase involved in cell wall biosynthesis
LISQYKPKDRDDAPAYRLPADYFRIRTYHVLTHGIGQSRWLRFLAIFTAPLVLLARTIELCRIFAHSGVTNVVACTGGDLLEIPAAYLAARLRKVPFHIYMFDRYGDQWRSRGHWLQPIHWLGRPLERLLVTHSNGIIVPNETLQADLANDYDVQSTVVHNPCDVAQYSTENSLSATFHRPLRIVYTGAIYEAHFDSFGRLLDALEQIGSSSLALHIYTDEPEHRLKQNNISHRAEVHPHQYPDEMPRIQQSADILFLPLAFKSSYPAIIRTSSPGKMGEYLAAGRPILVHAPPESFPAWYFKKHNCGVVVDQPDVQLLINAINQIRRDAAWAGQLAQHAVERARSDFDAEAVRRVFYAALLHRQ